MKSASQIFKKTGKVFLGIFLCLTIFIVGILIFINTNNGKQIIKKEVTKYLYKKLQTNITIGSVDYSFPKWLRIKNIYLEDKKGDTLLFGEELSVDLDMIKLIQGNTDIKKIFLKNFYFSVSRAENETDFNYQFILNAFSGNKVSTENKDTAEMKLTLSKLIFDNVKLNFKDSLVGKLFSVSIKNLELKTNKFQPDRLNFDIDNLIASNVQFLMKDFKEAIPKKIETVLDSNLILPYNFFINVKNINLKYIDVLVENKNTGMYNANNIGTLTAKNITYSIAQAKATVDELLLDSANITFVTPKKVNNSGININATNVPNLWIYAAKQFVIKNSFIKYDDNTKPNIKGLDFAHIEARRIKVNVNDFFFSENKTTASITQLAFADKSGFALDTTHANILFTDTALSLTKLYAKMPNSVIETDIQLTYDSLETIIKDPINTFLQATVFNSSIAFNDIYLMAPALEPFFPKAQFAGQVLKVNTFVKGNLQQLYFPFLQLNGLSGSNVKAKGTIYNISDTKKISFDLAFEQSNIFKKDLLKFVPSANQKALSNLPNIIALKGKILGNKNNILTDVQLNAKDFAFTGKVNLKNYSDPAKLQFNINAQNVKILKNLIVGFLPPTLLQSIELPQIILAYGKLIGDKNNIITDLKVNSSYGRLNIKGFVKNFTTPKQVNYDIQIITPNYAIGKLIKKESVIGNVAGTFYANGIGFDYKIMQSRIEANFTSFEYNKYNYKKLLLNATLNNGNLKSIGKINDENLKLNYTLNANVANKYPTINAFIQVDTAQLNALHFTKDTVNFSVNTIVNAENLQPRNLAASIFLDSLKLQNGKFHYALDSTSLVATSTNGIVSILLSAPFANLHVGGAFDYDKIAISLQQYINSYYKLPGYKPSYTKAPNQQFAIRGLIKQSPIITSFVPGLVGFDDINFTGRYTSAVTDSALEFNASVPKLIYENNRISKASININAKNAKLNYSVSFDTLTTASNVFYRTSVSGAAEKDSISFNALTKNIKNKNWFELGANFFTKENNYYFQLQDSLTLNYEKWKVASDNLITYSPVGILINNFSISSDTASIVIKSQQLLPNSPIDIDINNFNLKSISSIVNKDTVFIAGILDMKATFGNFKKTFPSFTGNATINDVKFKQNSVGNIAFNAKKITDNNMAANVALTGFGNNVEVKGNYYLNDNSKQFDAEVQIKKLSFKTLEIFSNGQLQNTTGAINGDIIVNGKFSEPHWNGEINFDTVKFVLTQLGTPYKIDKQKIVLDYPVITFPKFTFTDSINNALIIDGKILSKSIMDYDLGLNINAKEFIVVNAKKVVNSQVYGYAAVYVDIGLTGNTAFPKIEGEIIVNSKSDLKIVLPQTGYSKNDGKTIVRFVDIDTFKFEKPNTGFEPAIIANVAFAKFINYNLNVEVTKNAALTILIDPTTGDEIKVQGDARLNIGVDPGGNLIIAGMYDLEKGYYDLHYQILQRKFNLIKGSTITFAGAALNANINITAEYIANTDSKNLLTNETTDVNSNQTNSFKQKIPFIVMLYLTGQLNKPIINFDIQLPKESKQISSELRSTIENKLTQIRNDPASVNKQVFSLLLFGKFVSEQSSDFFKGNGGGFNDIARQSVSQFLSSTINEIASDIIKGIDIDLNLNAYNDYRNGGNVQRTDFNVAVSKTFANDRLTISVGKSFGVEGQDAAAKSSGSNTGFRPDITVSYKLSTDGKYMIRAYTKNQFEVTVDGYVIETGVSFLVTMDYDKFSELFKRNKKNL